MSFLKPASLDILSYTSQLCESPDLSNVLIICCQHLVDTTYEMFETLLSLGLKKSNLFAMGKCYSTNPKTYMKLQKEGYNISPLSIRYNSKNDYDKDFDARVSIFLTKIIETHNFSSFDKVILVDDGGKLIKAFNFLKQNFKNVIAVEQTSSGFNDLKNKHLSFSIINVARSFTKINHETELLKSLINQILISDLPEIFNFSKHVLVIGNGTIGKAISKLVANNNNLLVLDKKNFESEEKYENCLIKILPRFDIIIGCTGKVSVPAKYHHLIKSGTLLVSTSSSDREFDAQSIRKRFPISQSCHQNLSCNKFTLINSGFPFPFNGNYQLIDRDEFLLTRAVILAGILQAVKTNSIRKGFQPLSQKFDLALSTYWLANRHSFNKPYFSYKSA